jgi:hypothetical protein
MKDARHSTVAMLVAGAIVAIGLTLSACSSGGTADAATPPGTPVGTTPTAPSIAPSPSTGQGGISLGGGALPDGWPAGLPAYDGGTLASAVVSDDGRNINAAWTDDIAMADAFASMEAALAAAGFTSSSAAGGADMLIETADMTSNDYVSDGFEVNVTVAPYEGGITVMLNASKR